MPLDNEQCAAVRETLATVGWTQVMEPLYRSRAKYALSQLALFPAERSGEFKQLADDQLRAIVRECEWMTAVWRNEIAASDHNRRLDELERGQIPAANP